MKKKCLSVVLILSLLSGMCPASAWAMEAEDASETGTAAETDFALVTGAGLEPGFTPETDVFPQMIAAGSEPAGTGELRVTMHRSAALAKTNFTVTLEGSAYARTEDLTAEAGSKESSLTFTGIADGENYILTVTAPNYLPYTQYLDFDGRCVQIDLYNDAGVNDGRTGEDKLFGVMPVGDVYEDGVIDDKDADAIANAVGGASSRYDLSGSIDGKVDVTDIAIAVRNGYRQTEMATPFHSISSAVLTQTVGVEASPDTRASGRLTDLLDQSKEDTVVSLSPISGKISPDTPVELVLNVKGAVDNPSENPENPDNPSEEPGVKIKAEALMIKPPVGRTGSIMEGVVLVEGAELGKNDEVLGNTTITSYISASPSETMTLSAARTLSAKPANDTQVERDGTIVIDLGTRVAIKKVTIRVTATADPNNLVEIGKVQFLSDFAERIPEPQLYIPTGIKVSNTDSDGLGYRDVTVTWDYQPNVTGYEVKISGPDYDRAAVTDQTSYTFVGDSYNGTVRAFQTYTVNVRSVNGAWKSEWSDDYTHFVDCTKAPPKPESVTVTPLINALKVSWVCKFDWESFTLFYSADGVNFTSVPDLAATSYTLSGLKAGVTYSVYVVAHNRVGDSPASATAAGTPTSPSGVELPTYNLLNVDAGDGTATTHITSIHGSSSADATYTIHKADGTTVDRAAATAEDWKVLLDNDPNSYLEVLNWDNGAYYNNFRGPIIELDGRYEMDTFCLSTYEGKHVNFSLIDISYKAADGTIKTIEDVPFYTRYDSQKRQYYEIRLTRPITTDYVEIHTGTLAQTNYQTICEVRLYYYDELEGKIAALFVDDQHTELAEGVTLETIGELRDLVNGPGGEANPHKDTMLADLNYAEALLNHNAEAYVVEVDSNITAKDSQSAAFAQPLSDYQPMGRVAAAGEKLVIYVTNAADSSVKRGSNAPLKLVATQYHPEVTAWQADPIQLAMGRNEVTIRQIGSYDRESGGSLYLQYTGSAGVNAYKVRVIGGGTKIPVLNVDGVAGTARDAAIEKYVAELQAYAAGTGVEDLHSQLHGPGSYDERNCFLNSTEICMENMMYSLPATQVWDAISRSGNPAQTLKDSIAAMEQEIDYFYQFKGLHRTAAGIDAYPTTRLNIRYHTMFTGAFMYAGGKHIGIEFDSTSAVLGLNSIEYDEATGKYKSGNLSGWGIAHEIGHCINAPDYQRVEVTNNIFAQLAKTGDGKEETTANFRTTYDKVYKAVAAGNTGHTGDLAVQLAMYWQLHLAYDINYAYKLYANAQDAQDAMFYARLEHYLREDRNLRAQNKPTNFTAAGGDQLFMQAACAAAGKDILDFFRAWGLTPSDETVTYAKKFEKEARKIQYIDDDSRLYRLGGGTGMSNGTTVEAYFTNATNSRINSNKVEISLSNTNKNEDAILGYEILRNGKMVAFVPATESSYTDIVTTENNRAFTYTVIGIDRLLHETAKAVLPEVKVCHDGSIGKDAWSIQTNMASPRDTFENWDDKEPERGDDRSEQKRMSAITALINNDVTDGYCGEAEGGAAITLNLGGVEHVTAVKITPVSRSYGGNASDGSDLAAGDLYKYRLFDYTVEVSMDGENWTRVKSGNAYQSGSAATDPSSWAFAGDVVPARKEYNVDTPYILYFNKELEGGGMDPYMYTYEAAYVRISTSAKQLALAELDVLGPTSDNVELIEEGYGEMAEDFTAGEYEDGNPLVIREGSVVFYGSYKGDPAYNVVLLKDQNGKVLDGSQIFLADVAEGGYLGETSDGLWIFWLEDKVKTDEDSKKEYNEITQLEGLKTVQVELYRVQDAFTLEGQRLTSTSLTMEIPDGDRKQIKFTGTGSDARPDDETLSVYVPSAAAVAAAAAWEQGTAVTATAHNPYQDAVAIGDAGAAVIDADYSPLRLIPKDGGITAQFWPGDGSAIAVQAELHLTAAPDSIAVQPAPRTNTYQSWKYDSTTGTLYLFAVIREGGLGEDTLSAGLEPSASCTLTTASLSVLSSDYELTSVDVSGISANFSKTNGDITGGDGSGGTGTPDTPDTPDIPNTTPGGSMGGGSANTSSTNVGKPTTSQNATTVSVSVNSSISGTTASATVSRSSMDEAVDSAVAEAAKQDTAPVVKIEIKTSAKADSLQVTLPVPSLKKLAKAERASLVITSGVAEVSLDSTALGALAEQAAGSTAVLKISPVDNSSLNAAQREAVGKATVVDLSIVSNGVVIREYNNGTITISLPYILPDGQSGLDVAVYYLDDSGSMTPCSTSYADGKVTFITTHLSLYVIGGVNSSAPDSAPAPERIRFTDVAADAYYADAVNWAAANGITTGMDAANTIFAPNNTCTRAQIVTFLWRAYGEPEPQTANNPFVDVKESDYFYKAVLWAAEKDITEGMNAENTFVPDGACIRAEAATFLYRAAGAPTVSGPSGFIDVPEGAYYTNAVNWAVRNEITNGMNRTDTFVPKDACTRAQIVVFLYRALAN